MDLNVLSPTVAFVILFLFGILQVAFGRFPGRKNHNLEERFGA